MSADARPHVFMAVKIQVTVIWDVMLCSVVARYQRFGEPSASIFRETSPWSQRQHGRPEMLVSYLPHCYTALQPSRPWLVYVDWSSLTKLRL